MAQLMPLPLTVSCFNKIQIDFTFLVPAHPGSPGKRAVKWLCVCVCVYVCMCVYYYYTCLMASSRAAWISWCQIGKTRLDFNEARDDGILGWQWHQLDHMQTICTSLQTDNHHSIFTGRMLFLTPNKLKLLDRDSSSQSNLSHHYRNSHAIWDHTVLPATRQR